MSLDRSLKVGGGLARHRNVLTRPERIARLTSQGKFAEGQEPTNLPKVGNRKLVAGGKTKKKDAAEEGATPAAGGKAAPAAKAAAPAAKGGKK